MPNKSKITVYSTATCGYCNMLHKWLKENKIEFQEKRVDKDYESAREMMLKSGQMGVPFTVIIDKDGKEHKVLGFDTAKISAALN
ncbi:MAG: glutaredoxin family protein [Candidatus Saccharibacteria bacterium]